MRDLCKRERDCVGERERAECENNTLNGWPNFQIKIIIKREILGIMKKQHRPG